MSKSCDRLSAADIAPPGAAIRLFPTHAEQSHVTTVYNSKTLPTGVAGLRSGAIRGSLHFRYI